MLAIGPFFIINNLMNKKFSSGFALETNELTKEADMLCSDAIINFKTVQSLGHEELIVSKFIEIIEPVNEVAIWYNFKIGGAMGFGQFVTYCAMAAMFYFASVLIDNSCDPATQICTINPEDVFMALFAIMFGMSHAGTVQAFGPDIGRASAAADRVFTIIQHPSDINAIQISKEDKHKKIEM